MNRPLRIELDGALYHITARGNRQHSIYRDDADRLVWLSLLGETCACFNFAIYAYCQMGNHYHLLLETIEGKLSRGMRSLNGTYSQYFNRKHGLVGHVFQGRYHAILCQRELYLQELARYITLNPVRANLAHHPGGWPWSSFAATMGMVDSPAWLRTDELLAHFGATRESARSAFELFTIAGVDRPDPLRNVSNRLVLGDDRFCQRIIGTKIAGNPLEIPRTHRRAIAMPLHEYFSEFVDPKRAMAEAYSSLAYSMPEIAAHARVSVKTVSRAVNCFKLKKPAA